MMHLAATAATEHDRDDAIITLLRYDGGEMQTYKWTRRSGVVQQSELRDVQFHLGKEGLFFFSFVEHIINYLRFYFHQSLWVLILAVMTICS